MHSARSERLGFTLIELLVVVVIIAILAGIAVPSYFKVLERARLTQAVVTLHAVRASQERYFTANGRFVTDLSNVNDLDIVLSGAPPRYGMRDYLLTLGKGQGGCADLGSAYSVMLIRVEDGVKVPSRYFKHYMMRYERCSDEVTFPGCPACAQDFTSHVAVQRTEKAAPSPEKAAPPPPPVRLQEADLRRLERSLRSTDITVRQSSIAELDAASGPEPLALLTGHLLAETDLGLRREVVQACARKSTSAVSCLSAALRDYEPQVRLDAAQSIKGLAAEAAAPAVADALFDQEVEVRRNAMLALRAIQQERLRAWQEKAARKPKDLFVPLESDRAIMMKALDHAGLKP